jgi:hypothetical protein
MRRDTTSQSSLRSFLLIAPLVKIFEMLSLLSFSRVPCQLVNNFRWVGNVLLKRC